LSGKGSGATRDSELRVVLFVCLTLVALGAIVMAAGIGRLFVSDGSADLWARWLCGAGGAVLAASLLGAMTVLYRLPPAKDDCALYGRHIVGLTFVLLVTGLGNAAAMSTLALEGGLGFSAANVIDAADPKKLDEADAKHKESSTAWKQAKRGLVTTEKTLERALAERASACAVEVVPASASRASRNACRAARRNVVKAEDDLAQQRNALADAEELHAQTEQDCATARETRKRALFFLLSVSTMTSLLGAAFYVVNRVRTKRPRYTPDDGSGFPPDDDASLDAGRASGLGISTVTVSASASPQDAAAPAPTNGRASSRPGSLASGNGVPAAGAPAGPVTATAQMTVAQLPPKSTAEPFDAHAFWSGAFFRIGEAVLFTFTFFWIIWSWKSTEYLVWLPVLALFVGMFVKTGETVIFRLGTRILFAADALLPAGPSPRPADPLSPTGPAPAAGGAQGSANARNGAAEAQITN
jgi:hypothetical protein